MTELRDDQGRLLAVHRERGADRLEAVIAGTPGGDPRHSPEGQALLRDEPELLVSIAVCAVELRCEYWRSWKEPTRGGVVWGRSVDHPGANLPAGYLAAEAGRPDLVRPCLERAAEHYRGPLERTDPRDEELAALVDRLEADSAAA